MVISLLFHFRRRNTSSEGGRAVLDSSGCLSRLWQSTWWIISLKEERMNEPAVKPVESCRSMELTQAASELRSGKSNVCVNLASEVQSTPLIFGRLHGPPQGDGRSVAQGSPSGVTQPSQLAAFFSVIHAPEQRPMGLLLLSERCWEDLVVATICHCRFAEYFCRALLY